MKKGRFCCSDWKVATWFYLAPVESSSRILCKHPGTEKPQHESKSWNQQLLILPALRVFLSQLSRCHVCTFLWLLGVFANSVSGGAPVLPHYSPLLLLLCLFPFILLYCFYSLSTLQSHLAHPLLFYKTSFLSPIKCASKTSTITRTKKFSFNFWFSSVFSVFLGRREKKYKYILGKVPIQNNSQGLASDVFPVVQNVNCHVPNLQKENNAVSIL